MLLVSRGIYDVVLLLLMVDFVGYCQAPLGPIGNRFDIRVVVVELFETD